MKRAVVPGTFDPITSGHLDVIERACQIFDEVVVAVAASKSKGGGPLFSLGERVILAMEATAYMSKVTVMPFEGLLVDFAVEHEADAVVKGLRAVTDFEYEFQQAALNYHLNPDIETMFVMSAPEYMYLSSSVVKEIASLKGNISGLVPPVVGEALVARFGCTY